MYGEDYRINIEVVENGFVVTVPDMDARKKMEAAAKKKNSNSPSPYMGDCTEKYACKTLDEVMTKVKDALSAMPEHEYQNGFKEAIKEK